MKSLVYPNWKRSLKMFVACAALSLSMVNTGGEALATAKPQKVAKTIETLQKSDQRWIQVDLSQQRLTAWQGRKPVYAIAISSGKKSTPTPIGTFKIQSKHKSTRMRGRGYDLPNVPYAMFYSGNYGIHGAYWHKRFGTPVSRGCVNLSPNHAKWLFNWASLGTPVVVQR